MLLAREILGDAAEPRFARRRIERVSVDSASAAKRRLGLVTDAGSEVAVDLDRGAYLRHGAVLFDDGERLVVVDRAPEPALVVRLAPGPDLVAHAVRLGHAFGNQHVPIEVDGDEIRVPITTSREIAERTVRALGVTILDLAFDDVPLGRDRPLEHGHTH
jgi:urease accessory protein